jgi:hypothetical protein
MPELPIRVETGRGTDDLRVYIKDRSSGVMLAGFTLSPEQIRTMLGGGHVDVDKAVMTGHFERVGKTMETETIIVTRDQLKSSTYDQMITDGEQLVRADRPGWDEYDGRRQNTGHIMVVMRRWA